MSADSKVAIITGASQGIGEGIVRGYLSRGYRVVANSRSIKPGAYEGAVLGDFADPEVADRVVGDAVANFGRVDTAPGVIRTPMHAPDGGPSLAAMHPIGRMGEVREIVDAVMYLESAGFVTGETLHVDGGAHAGRW